MNSNESQYDMTRRNMLKMSACCAAAITGGDWLAQQVQAATKPKPKATAKAVIEIWLAGGPSQIDTFDPKPNAGKDYTGIFNQTVKTNVKGIEICSLLPKLARQADKYSLIRSMTHGVRAHETAAYMMQTGRPSGGALVYPSIGAIVSLFKGYDHGYTDLIPPFISLTRTKGRFAEGGFLGTKYKSFATGGDPNRTPFYVDGIISKGVPDSRQRDRRKLLADLDTLGKTNKGNPIFTQADEQQRKAYELILGKERKLFDLTTENKTLRERYGRNPFGQSCLMARRLVERGVKYITINSGGWDTHKRHFDVFRQRATILDQGVASLLQDLADRKLLDSTVVWCCGEFGRTPKVQWNPPWNGGRGHFGDCFSALVAGGGFKPGRVVGRTDETASNVVERPVYPQDFLGSILECMGIDPNGALPNPQGLPLKVMPTVIGKSKGNGRLHEIMKS